MNIADWFIKNNRTATILLVLVALMGLQTFRTMSRLENPDFTIRTAMVITYFPGASPQRVEELLTDKLEKKVREIAEVERVDSQSMAGVSVIAVHVYERYKDMRPIWSKLRDKVDDARAELPEGVIGPSVNDEFGDVFGVVVALTGDGFSYREMKDVADLTRDELLKIPDVAKVDLYGTQEERVFVEISNARLAQYGYSPHQLARLIDAQNTLLPGGRARVGPESVIIEATGEFKSIEQLKRMSLVPPAGGQTAYLEDIAEIRRGFVDPPTTMTRYNGRPCIILAASMIAGANIIHMGEAVKARLNELQRDLEVGLDYQMLVYQPKFVERSISDFTVNLIEAIAFVLGAVLAFAGLRTGLIVGALVPMAMLVTIALMPPLGVSLQQVSIASLIIALGILVDNGIVTSENILVRMTRGEDRRAAALGAVRELWLPLLTSSLTTIVAFMPIATAQSSTGEYCLSLFVVITLALGASWVLSLTMIPMLCFYFLRPASRATTFDGPMYRRYRTVLLSGLRRPWLFLGAIVAATVVAVWGFRFIPNIFFPPNEREMVVIDLWQPYGTDIRATADEAGRLERALLADPDVESVGTFVGSGGPRWYLSMSIEQDLPSYAFLVVNTRDIPSVNNVIARTREELARSFPDSRYGVNRLEMGPPVGSPIQIRLSGSDMDRLYALRERVAAMLRDVSGVVNVRDDWGEWAKKMVVDVNQEKAKRAGLSSSDIALSLNTQVSGLEASQYREGGDIIPIVVRAQESFREDLGKLDGMNVYSYAFGRSVPLLQVADTALTWQPGNIRRRNQTRTMTIKADVIGRFPSEALAEIMPGLDRIRGEGLPPGYDIEVGGEHEESDRASASIMAGMPMAMGLLVLILVFQFNSLRRPLIIALTIPPMMIGITAGLLITSSPFGFMAMLGMISLAGVIVNNAIMMIDRMEIERAAGQSWQDAIVVSAQRRLRPILMTATTTIIGLVPLSLQGGELWRPMANTLMFGLGFATILTLVQCPVLCSLFFRAPFRDYQWNPEAIGRTSE